MTPATEIQVIEPTANEAVNGAPAVEAEDAPAAPTLYPLDDQMVEISLKNKGATAIHRLRRPSAHELHEREQLIEHEVQDLNDEEIEEIYETDAANLKLWDLCAVDLFGYTTAPGVDRNQWSSVTPAARARVPAKQKELVILSYLASAAATVERGSDEDVFSLIGEPEVRIKLFIGRSANRPVVTHIVRQPTEEEWRRHDRRAERSTQIKGTKRTKVRLRTNCLAAIELYDAILLRIEGASLGSLGWADHMRDQFVASVEPLHKVRIVSALANDYGAQLQD